MTTEINWSTKGNALILARTIRDYWLEKTGEIVRTWIVPELRTDGHHTIYTIKSDMVAGLPRNG